MTDATLDALRLHLVPGVGPRMMEQLLEAFGTPGRVLTASEAELRSVPGVGPKIARGVRTARDSDVALKEYHRCLELGVDLFVRGSDEYPHLLAAIPDAPAVLYCRGAYLPADEIAIAIVGSRRCTYYGISQAERIAGGLARAGITVVSGLARGIDAAAHRAAMAAGGRTLAIVATGLESVYPPEHADLANEVAAAGAMLTEFRLAQRPLAGLFPQRNRIISGLCLGVIVIEAGRGSGALHTARHAIEQNRDVFAVPGRIDSAASEGCHDLIRDGAALIRGVDDVLEQLGPLLRPVNLPVAAQNGRPQRNLFGEVATGMPDSETASPTREVRSVAELSLTEQERQILDCVPGDPTSIDRVLATCDLEISRFLATLTVLEMKRLVRRFPGNLIARAP